MTPESATPGSDYLFPENNVGLTISNASTYLLPRLVGSRALPLVLDGTRISGDRARELGLIDVFVDSEAEVLTSAVALLQRWSERGLATRFHLRMLRPPIEEVEAAIARENAVAARPGSPGPRPRVSTASSRSSEPAGPVDESRPGRRGPRQPGVTSRRTSTATGSS